MSDTNTTDPKELEARALDQVLRAAQVWLDLQPMLQPEDVEAIRDAFREAPEFEVQLRVAPCSVVARIVTIDGEGDELRLIRAVELQAMSAQ